MASEVQEQARTLTEESVGQLKTIELREELRKRQQPIYGRKNELIKRLRAVLVLEEALREPAREDVPEGEDDDDDDVGTVDQLYADARSVQETSYRQREVLFTFRDVEESLSKFSGDDDVVIQRWLNDFERTAAMSRWSDVHKVTYARRLMTGSAKRFVMYMDWGETWPQLKRALMEEFGRAIDGFQVHQRLSAEKKKVDETFQQYTYRMMEIASQANIGTTDTIKYIINGIQDDAANKSMLYGAKTYRELKERLEDYQEMKREAARRPKQVEYKKQRDAAKPTHAKPNEKTKFCFVCGEAGHISNACPNKSRGVKCFKCGELGHIASKCTGANKMTNAVLTNEKKPHLKEVMVNNQNMTALVDTGSDLTFIRAEEYIELGSPRLGKNRITFEGLGSRNNKTLGEFDAIITVDGEEYTTKFHVIEGRLLKQAVLLGSDFLKQTELLVRDGEVRFQKIESNVPEVFRIDIASETNDIDLTHVKESKYREEIKQIISTYKPEKKKEVGISTKIILKDEKPVTSAPRRLSAQDKRIVKEIMEEWLQDGIIQPSNSEYASPLVLVKKKDGSTRVCVDYRELNKKIERPQFPLPIIEDQINELQGSKVFTTIDLKNGYFHVPVHEKSRQFTAFVTPTSQYEFLKTPFGLSIAPGVFQKFINAVFKELINEKVVLAYMDDLIIPSSDNEKAMNNLRRVVDTARDYGLHINWKKCKFLQEEIEYLDHIVSKDTVRPTESKYKAVAGFPLPTTVKTVQSFLGLTGYLRKFIPNYSLIAKPLTELLKKDVKFHFEEKEKEAVVKLKSALSCGPVLRLYRQGAETELHTDASCCGYGMILMQKGDDDQKWHPIYYASGKTTPAEEKYSSYELEVLAIIKGLRKFRIYLLGIPFKIVTDCQAFAMTMKKKDLSARVARWALLLQEFNYEVCHRPGRQMPHVDALSRNPLPSVLQVEECKDGLISRIKRAQQEDEELAPILKMIQTKSIEGYAIKNGILCKEHHDDLLIVVPKKLQVQLIQRAHERGHFGITKTEDILVEDYWFRGMRKKIEQVVNNCVTCILAERKRGKSEGFIQSIDKGGTPLETLHIDHVGPMAPTQKRYGHLLVMIDAFTKFTWLYPTRSTATTDVIDRLKRQAAIFGNPRRIITDRGTAFTSNEFKAYCKDENIQHLLITTGIPRGNGQVERVHRTVIPLLAKLAAPNPGNWYKYVDSVQKIINNTVSRSTKQTPFKLMIGVDMRVKENPEIRQLIEDEWISMLEKERDELRESAKQSIIKVQEENRRCRNKQRKEASNYQVGDLVAIRRTQFGPGLKLQPHFFGPYEVTKVMRHDRYLVKRIGDHEGPRETSTAADSMKPWITSLESINEE